MAIIQCPECKKMISANVETCPHCGNVITKEKIQAFKKKQRKTWIFFVICFAFVLSLSLISPDSDSTNITTTTSTQVTPVKEIVTNSSWDASVYQVKSWLKETVKDPKSLEFIEWSKVIKNKNGSSTVRVKYRVD